MLLTAEEVVSVGRKKKDSVGKRKAEKYGEKKRKRKEG